MTFGQGQANFLVDSPEAVAQAVLTRLRLVQGEWFVDTTAGTPYSTEILGKTTQRQRDFAIRSQILGTEGVKEIVSYSSSVVGRKYLVEAKISTIYGTTIVRVSL